MFVKQKVKISLHYANQQIYNFETLKGQILYKAIDDQKHKLVMHTNETIMRRNLLDIEVQNNSGNYSNMY